MITAEALEIVLGMAREHDIQGVEANELEAIKEVETLLKSYEDNDYNEGEYITT